MKVAVVGHVEWCRFVRVEELPRAGEIVHAHEYWEEAAGGGAVAAAELARLNGSALLVTALGDDELGRRAKTELETLGIRVHATRRRDPQRLGFVYIDAVGERTITVVGDKLSARAADDLPWEELDGADGVYFTGGDEAALRSVRRRAKVLVATARELPTLQRAGVELDALVASGDDEGERHKYGDLEPAPKLVVSTAGALGGWAQPGGPFRAVPPPGRIEDSYGAGDSFAAALTYALADGQEPQAALAFAAERGAAALLRRGAHGEVEQKGD
ncbi:MAG: PfkB family carbohydrate kinase [Gaiellaceae bacterium]